MSKILPFILVPIMAYTASCTPSINDAKSDTIYRNRETKIEAQYDPVLYSEEAYNKLRTSEDKEFDPICDMVYGPIGSLYFFDVDDKIYIATISNVFSRKRSIKIYVYNGDDENICKKAPYKIIEDSKYINGNDNFIGELSDFEIIDTDNEELSRHFHATQKNKVYDKTEKKTIEIIDEVVLEL